MKKIIAWFTFIELVVVITIIWLVWTFWVNSFLKFYKNREFLAEIWNTQTFLKSEDLKVKKKEIFDYKAFFEKEKKYFYAYENIFNEKEKITIKRFSENFLSKNSEITFEKENELTKGEKIFLNIYKNDKLEKTMQVFDKDSKEKEWENSIKSEDNKIFKLNFEEKKLEESKNYDFYFSKNETTNPINNIIIKKYNSEKNFELKQISENKKKNWDFQKFELKNIWWKKALYLDSEKKKEVYLFFEDEDWKQDYLLIK